MSGKHNKFISLKDAKELNKIFQKMEDQLMEELFGFKTSENIEPMTEETIKAHLSGIFKELEPVTPREVTILQGCLEYGSVTRSKSNLSICGNPKCSSCSMLDDLIKKEFKT